MVQIYRDTVFSLVEPYYAGLCHNNTPQGMQNAPTIGGHFVPFAVLLWHESWLPCTERSYYRCPDAIKNQRKGRNTSIMGVFHALSWFFMASESWRSNIMISDQDSSTLLPGGSAGPAGASARGAFSSTPRHRGRSRSSLSPWQPRPRSKYSSSC